MDEDEYGFDEFDEEGSEGFDGEPSGYTEEEETAEDTYVREYLANYGIMDIDKFVINVHDVVDPSNIRGERFVSLTDALDYLVQIGVVGFSHVVYFPEDDEYGADVPDSSDGDAD